MQNQSKTTTLPPTAFIGGGNMAYAIVNGLIAQGFETSQMHIVEPNEEARNRLKALQVCVYENAGSAQEVLKTCQIVVWAVKPQAMKQVCEQTCVFLLQNALHISIAAGVSIQSIENWLQSKQIVRTMPNTPALIGQGVTALYAGSALGLVQRGLAQVIAQAMGQVVWLDREEDLDSVTALSGSGPAYVFYFLECMQQAGVAMGLTPEVARHLAQATFSGATALAAWQKQTPLGTLREQVTSKGGTTFAALQYMNNHGVQNAFIQAMHAAKERAQTLKQEFQ